MAKFLYGPIASRRFGRSLGVSPVTDSTCNFGCVYCQLGRIRYSPHERAEHADVDAILEEFDRSGLTDEDFDALSVVGDGEPLLHNRLGELLRKLKSRTRRPVTLVTNGSLFVAQAVREAAAQADIVSPSLDAYDEASFARINRPYGGLSFASYYEGLQAFTHAYEGQLWLEMMFVKGLNDDAQALKKFQKLLEGLRYDRLYLNTVVRPPIATAEAVDGKDMQRIQAALGGIPLDFLSDADYADPEQDALTALKNLIRRHPLHTFEIEGFLRRRGCEDAGPILQQLAADPRIEVVTRAGYTVYRPR